MREVMIKVYKFDELEEATKNKVIEEAINFLIDTYDEDIASEGLKKAIKDAEKMQTPWFTGEYVWDYCKDEVMELCQGICEYERDGEIFIK